MHPATNVQAVPDSMVRTCPGCREEYFAFATSEGPKPEQCPDCEPPSMPEAAPRSRRREYEGNILSDLSQAGVNVHRFKHAHFRWEGFDLSRDPQALEASKAWIGAWKESHDDPFPSRDWMYFFGVGSEARDRGIADPGQTGNGKTFLAVAMARHLIETGYLAPDRFHFTSAEQILLDAEASYRSDDEDSVKKLLRRYTRYELLVIDDFGVRKAGDHPIRIFAELARRREGRGTIWTSNLSLETVQRQDRRMQRLTSRIMGECGDGGAYIVRFEGPDRRRERVTG